MPYTLMDITLSTITILKSVVPILLSLFMFFHNMPRVAELKNYKNSLRVLAVAYLSLGVANIMHGIVGTPNTNILTVLIFAGIYAIVSSLQALLFTYSLITLINTYYVTWRRLVIQLIPISLLSALTITGFVYKNLLYLQTVITIFAVYYFLQLAYYTYLYISEERKFAADTQNFFVDDESKRLKWVRIAFYSSLIIGIWALFIILFPQVNMLEIIFSLVCLVFYSYLAFRYINYVNDFYVLQPVVIREEKNITGVEVKVNERQFPAIFPVNGKIDFIQTMEKWVSDKSYKASGITITELAEQLQTNRTYLSNYINTYKNTSFSQWLNTLRIEEAQRIMRENPNISFRELALDLGYKEQSSFSKQFTNIVGVSPSEWKKGCRKP